MANEKRLIDADALRQKWASERDFMLNRWGGYGALLNREKGRVDELDACIADVEAAPTVDAVPVVRCKDCKHWIHVEVCERKMEEMKVKVSVKAGATIPNRAHKNDAGLDLYATKGGWIFPKCKKTFGTGLHASIPAGYVGMLTSKSGMMSNGITSRGTIDSGYTGEIKAVLFNHSWRFIRIKPHQKITQLVIMPIITPDLELVDDLEATERGEGGFGSTGKF